VTILGGGHVIHRRIFADGVHTVMTAFAGIGHALVIERTRGKTVGVVAHAAIFGCRDMCGRLTDSIRAVMTGSTIAGDTIVSKDRGFKRAGIVAEMAILVRGNMVCRRIFAGGKYTVMTAVTTRSHTGMVKHAGGKTGGDMAYGAILGSGNMIRRFACGRSAVMAGSAVVHDTGVIEYSR